MYAHRCGVHWTSKPKWIDTHFLASRKETVVYLSCFESIQSNGFFSNYFYIILALIVLSFMKQSCSASLSEMTRAFSSSCLCVEFKRIKFYSILCEWLEQWTKESMQNKSQLIDRGWSSVYAGRATVTSVLNYHEQSTVSWPWFMVRNNWWRNVLLLGQKLTWAEKIGPAVTTNRSLRCK